nr:hypothetical protein [Tanacetum cinerariifolium]
MSWFSRCSWCRGLFNGGNCRRCTNPQTSSSDQFHCFGCGDPLEDGVRCQRCTCKWCGYGLREGICWFCAPSDGNSSINAPNSNSFNEPLNVFTHPPHPQYESYSCELCETILTMVMIIHHGSCLFMSRNRATIKTLESTIPLNGIVSQIPPSIANTPILPIKDLKDSLIMGDEDLSTIPKKESDEFIKSSVEDFIPILCESKDTSGSDSECDLPSCDDFYPINIHEGKSVTFSNPFSIQMMILPLVMMSHDLMRTTSSKASYLDEPVLLVTPLFDANEDECFDPGGDVDEINAFDIPSDFKDGFYDSEGDYSINHQEDLNQQRIRDVQDRWDKLKESQNELLNIMQSFYEMYLDEMKSMINQIQIEDYHNERIDSHYIREYEIKIDELKESTILLNEIISQVPLPIAITLVLLNMEPEDFLIMGDEDLSTIPEKESDEVIKSSVEELVPIPSESEDTSGSYSEYDLSSCDDFSPIDVPEGKSVTFSNLLFNLNDDFTSSDDESLSDEDVPEENFKIYSNPLFEFNDEYISSDDVDKIELLRDPSTPKMSVASILEGFTNEPPLKENDDLFDLDSKENKWKKILYDAPTNDLMTGNKGVRILFLTSTSSLFIFSAGGILSEWNFHVLQCLFKHLEWKSDGDFFSTCFVPNITMIWGESSYRLAQKQALLGRIAPEFENSRARGFVHRSLELQSLACLYMGI